MNRGADNQVLRRHLLLRRDSQPTLRRDPGSAELGVNWLVAEVMEQRDLDWLLAKLTKKMKRTGMVLFYDPVLQPEGEIVGFLLGGFGPSPQERAAFSYFLELPNTSQEDEYHFCALLSRRVSADPPFCISVQQGFAQLIKVSGSEWVILLFDIQAFTEGRPFASDLPGFQQHSITLWTG